MAIRSDFSAGEVLSAADLNDTFASKVPYAYGTATPSTTVDGFVWYDENETPPAPKFWDGAAFQAVSTPGGLVHIATESFSAVSSVSLNGVFTSAYADYLLIGTVLGSTNNGLLQRLRASGTDNSTASSYISTSIWANSTTPSATSFASNYFGGVDVLSSTIQMSFRQTLINPAGSVNTHWLFDQGGRGSRTGLTTGYHNQNASYDGITFYTSDGTNMTGTIRVYGYQNS